MSKVDRTVFKNDGDTCLFTDLMVLHSPAGYYIGRLCFDKVSKLTEPYTRESNYFESMARASQALKDLSFEVRNCPENYAGYRAGTLPWPVQGCPECAGHRGRCPKCWSRKEKKK